MITFGWYYDDETPRCGRLRPILTMRLGGAELTLKGGFEMKLPIDMKLVGCSVAYSDRAGNPAVVDGIPLWATDRPDLVSVIPSGDGFACDIIPVGPLGTAQITVTADADLGDGVRELVTLGTIELVAAEAVAGTITFPEPIGVEG